MVIAKMVKNIKLPMYKYKIKILESIVEIPEFNFITTADEDEREVITYMKPDLVRLLLKDWGEIVSYERTK